MGMDMDMGTSVCAKASVGMTAVSDSKSHNSLGWKDDNDEWSVRTLGVSILNTCILTSGILSKL